MIRNELCTLAQLADFDALIDVRSPAEYAEDHIPGAINCPVLDNDERARVGTLYTQVSPFEARKLGAVLVARNIARHIEERLLGQPKGWRPLVYCWRGGQRSAAFSHVLQQVGWAARRLQGGYKTWRRHVLENIEVLPGRFSFRVIAGPTGSAKSRVLEALAASGAQILHLEQLAAHKGSILGDLPGAPQPSQKMFETRLYSALSGLDPAQPVYVEAESRRIGSLSLPTKLHEAIHRSRCLRISASVPARVNFLLGDYDYLLQGEWLLEQLQRLKELQGKETLARWQALAQEGDFSTLAEELLTRHYDPLYERSQRRSFVAFGDAPIYEAKDLSEKSIVELARRILEGKA